MKFWFWLYDPPPALSPNQRPNYFVEWLSLFLSKATAVISCSTKTHLVYLSSVYLSSVYLYQSKATLDQSGVGRSLYR